MAAAMLLKEEECVLGTLGKAEREGPISYSPRRHPAQRHLLIQANPQMRQRSTSLHALFTYEVSSAVSVIGI